jgi:flagellar biogenesis protein FliO
MAAPLLVVWLSLWAGPSPVIDAGVVEPPRAVAEASRVPALPEPELPRAEPPDLGAPDLDLGWTLVRTMVALGMVVALVYLTLNVGLRKLLGIRQTPAARIVTVLERVALDQKRALFVVEAAGEVFLIGGADTSLTLLSKLDPIEVTRLKGATGAAPMSLRLSPLLQKLLGRKDDTPPPPT